MGDDNTNECSVQESTSAGILMVEPFYGGSHKVLVDLLVRACTDYFGPGSVNLITMKAKKWHWRARTGALYVADAVPSRHNFRVLFASSVLNLAELMALRPDLAGIKKIIYFHENQLVYPVRQYKDRDFQYGYNQILTCLVADTILFNSNFNRISFLDSMNAFFKVQPDCRPKDLKCRIEGKCQVLYFPLPKAVCLSQSRDYSKELHVIWPHRWEHDKGPETFLDVVSVLAAEGCCFRVSVVGEQFAKVPEKFQDVWERLNKERIAHWGFLPCDQYRQLLGQAHIAVSTAEHEFFGVSMLEATMYGCYPLCPARLVYPEIYPEECLYNSTEELLNRLRNFANDLNSAKESVLKLSIDYSRFSEELLVPKYIDWLR